MDSRNSFDVYIHVPLASPAVHFWFLNQSIAFNWTITHIKHDEAPSFKCWKSYGAFPPLLLYFAFPWQLAEFIYEKKNSLPIDQFGNIHNYSTPLTSASSEMLTHPGLLHSRQQDFPLYLKVCTRSDAVWKYSVFSKSSVPIQKSFGN